MRETSAGQTVSGREIRDLSRCNCRTASVPHFSTGIWGSSAPPAPRQVAVPGGPRAPGRSSGAGTAPPRPSGAEGSGRRRLGLVPGGWGLFLVIGACSRCLWVVHGFFLLLRLSLKTVSLRVSTDTAEHCRGTVWRVISNCNTCTDNSSVILT